MAKPNGKQKEQFVIDQFGLDDLYVAKSTEEFLKQVDGGNRDISTGDKVYVLEVKEVFVYKPSLVKT